MSLFVSKQIVKNCIVFDYKDQRYNTDNNFDPIRNSVDAGCHT